jgi:hypothetical protein
MRVPAALLVLSVPTFAAAPKAITTFFYQHCVECHDADVKKGGLDLTALSFDLKDPQLFEKWVKVHDSVADGEMPPKKKPRPDSKLAEAFLDSLDGQLRETSAAQTTAQGRTLVRRLNRIEYENTVRDLLHIDLPLAGLLPEDTPMHGFDTVAEGLRFSQLQIEKYLEAADAALDAAVDLRSEGGTEKSSASPTRTKRASFENLALPDDPPADPKKKYQRKRAVFRALPMTRSSCSRTLTTCSALSKFKMRRGGTYRIRLSAYGYQSAGEPVTARIYANDYSIGQAPARTLGHAGRSKPRVVESHHAHQPQRAPARDALPRRLRCRGPTPQRCATRQSSSPVAASPCSGSRSRDRSKCKHWPPPSVKALFGDVPVVQLETKKSKIPGKAKRPSATN